ncbi:unnamed protein product [Calypogeia fissa]
MSRTVRESLAKKAPNYSTGFYDSIALMSDSLSDRLPDRLTACVATVKQAGRDRLIGGGDRRDPSSSSPPTRQEPPEPRSPTPPRTAPEPLGALRPLTPCPVITRADRTTRDLDHDPRAPSTLPGRGSGVGRLGTPSLPAIRPATPERIPVPWGAVLHSPPVNPDAPVPVIRPPPPRR